VYSQVSNGPANNLTTMGNASLTHNHRFTNYTNSGNNATVLGRSAGDNSQMGIKSSGNTITASLPPKGKLAAGPSDPPSGGVSSYASSGTATMTVTTNGTTASAPTGGYTVTASDSATYTSNSTACSYTNTTPTSGSINSCSATDSAQVITGSNGCTQTLLQAPEAAQPAQAYSAAVGASIKTSSIGNTTTLTGGSTLWSTIAGDNASVRYAQANATVDAGDATAYQTATTGSANLRATVATSSVTAVRLMTKSTGDSASAATTMVGVTATAVPKTQSSGANFVDVQSQDASSAGLRISTSDLSTTTGNGHLINAASDPASTTTVATSGTALTMTSQEVTKNT
jgi:hypothetical protein